MAEIKNTFLKSKMNKDLDDRLLPNGEYRDAQNISVGKSEDADVGALENIIGNSNVTPNLPYGDDFEIIGYYSDAVNDRIITFVTNYTDPYTNGEPTYIYDANMATPTPSPLYNCHICVYDQNTQNYNSVVSGEFLNFSTTDKVLGVNLIENLLFFTDNRNQPRKINIQTAIEENNYYTSEDNISVAKYNPYSPISLVKKVVGVPAAALTSSTDIQVDLQTYNSVEAGMIVIGRDTSGVAISGLESSDYVSVLSKNTGTGPVYNIVLTRQDGATVSVSTTTTDTITFLKSTMTNEEETADWPGDPQYLEDKYVRFSYRFQFDDGEYSIMAPFTQIAYIPKQKGYFFSGDEDASYRSTVLEFMENEINNVELLIDLPAESSLLQQQYKIKGIDILYKESNDLVVKVLETIPVGQIQSSSVGNVYTYEYQSRKPYKTLTQAETVRVYDKVPVRAKAQETSGNRVMYGNFYDEYTPPDYIDYNVDVFPKDTVLDDSFVQYPNHTVKQNRNYQIGFILADKFGRQSPVILSPVDFDWRQGVGLNIKGGSTIFHPYKTGATQPNVRDWFGDQIQVLVNLPIESTKSISLGTPGLYANRQKAYGTGDGFAIATGYLTSYQGNPNASFVFTLNTSKPNNINVPRVGDYLRGEYRDYVKVTSVSENAGTYTVGCDGTINDSYNKSVSSLSADIKFAYIINQTGWYSYKVVVKQTEQEYYNCYLPGLLDGYPTHTGSPPYPTNETNLTAHAVLINDNINKIPRDLSEVGPDQKQYRSSVQLFGRVQNNYDTGTATTINIQYFPERKSNTASTIGYAVDLNMGYDEIASTSNFYQLDTNPIIARISTLDQAIGVTATNMVAELAIYETEPVTSLLDIFWETTTVGLISDLNEDVLTGVDTPVDITDADFTYSENQNPDGTGTTTGESDSPYVTDAFWPLNAEGLELENTGQLSSFYPGISTWYTLTITTELGNTVTGQFTIEQDIDPVSTDYGSYRLKLTPTTPTTQPTLNYAGSNPDSTTYNVSLSVLDDDGRMSTNFTFSTTLINKVPFLWGTDRNTPVAQTLTQLNKEDWPFTTVRTIGLGDITDNSTTFYRQSNGAYYKSGYSSYNQEVGVYLQTIPSRPSQYYDVFKIDHTVSALQMYNQSGYSSPWSRGGSIVGYYDLTFRVKDAMTNVGGTGYQNITDQGSTSASTLNSTSDYNKKIRILPGSIDSGLVSTCLTTHNGDSRQFSGTTVVANYGWFVSSNASVTYPTLPSGQVYGFIPPGSSPVFVNPVRVGSAGFAESNNAPTATILMDLMTEVRKTGNTDSSDICYFTWYVYYSSTPGGSWTLTNVVDTNNVDLNSSTFFNGSQPGLSAGGSISVGNRSAINIPVSLSKKGEYFIRCQIRNVGNNTNNWASSTWINTNDSNYPSCAPINGDNAIGSAGRDADYFQYEVSSPASPIGADCSTSLTDTVYARTPYGHTVTQFFTDTALTDFTTAYTSATKAYQYVPGSSTKDGLVNKRTAYIDGITQTTTGSANSINANGYKTNKFYVDIDYSDTVGDTWRKSCDSPASSDNFLTGANDPQVYLFSDYS